MEDEQINLTKHYSPEEMKHLVKNINALDKVYMTFMRILGISTALFLFIIVLTQGAVSVILAVLVLIWCIISFTVLIRRRKELQTDEVVLNVLRK